MADRHVNDPLGYLYEELPPNEMAEAREHLAQCAECRRLLKEIRDTVKVYRRAARPEAPRGLAARTAAMVLESRRRRDSEIEEAIHEAERDIEPAPPVTACEWSPPFDSERDFEREKGRIIRESGGWRAMLFHPAWTVAASVLLVCAVLVHISPRSETHFAPVAEQTIDYAPEPPAGKPKIHIERRQRPARQSAAKSASASDATSDAGRDRAEFSVRSPRLAEAEALNAAPEVSSAPDDADAPLGQSESVAKEESAPPPPETPGPLPSAPAMRAREPAAESSAASVPAGNAVPPPPRMDLNAAPAPPPPAPAFSSAPSSPPAPVSASAPVVPPAPAQPAMPEPEAFLDEMDQAVEADAPYAGEATLFGSIAPPAASAASEIDSFAMPEEKAPSASMPVPTPFEPVPAGDGRTGRAEAERRDPPAIILDMAPMAEPPQLVARPEPVDGARSIINLTFLAGLQMGEKDFEGATRTIELIRKHDVKEADRLARILVEMVLAESEREDAEREAATAAPVPDDDTPDEPEPENVQPPQRVEAEAPPEKPVSNLRPPAPAAETATPEGDPHESESSAETASPGGADADDADNGADDALEDRGALDTGEPASPSDVVVPEPTASAAESHPLHMDIEVGPVYTDDSVSPAADAALQDDIALGEPAAVDDPPPTLRERESGTDAPERGGNRFTTDPYWRDR